MDLGHYGRELQHFLVRLPLIILEPVSTASSSFREVTTVTTGEHLFGAIDRGIQEYSAKLAPQSTGAKLISALSEEVQVIAALVVQTKDERIQLFLEAISGSDENGPIPNFYQIKGLEAAHYRA